MSEKLPYKTEYAKSERSSCKGCRSIIAKDSLRIAELVESHVHDGMLIHWYHPRCFFNRIHPDNIADIANFDNLRWIDQEFIRKMMGEKEVVIPFAAEEDEPIPVPDVIPSSSGGRKRSKSSNMDFKIEYANSDEYLCTGCDDIIAEGKILISKKSLSGQYDLRYDFDCFVILREDLEFLDPGTLLPGYHQLTQEDQDLIKISFPAINNENTPPPPKKARSTQVFYNKNTQLKMQNDRFFQIRDRLSALKKKDIKQLLEYNDHYIRVSQSEMLDALADQMAFGALPRCERCHRAFKFESGFGYRCKGMYTEWTRCNTLMDNPPRSAFRIPEGLKEKYDFLRNYMPKVEKRQLRADAVSAGYNVDREERMMNQSGSFLNSISSFFQNPILRSMISNPPNMNASAGTTSTMRAANRSSTLARINGSMSTANISTPSILVDISSDDDDDDFNNDSDSPSPILQTQRNIALSRTNQAISSATTITSPTVQVSASTRTRNESVRSPSITTTPIRAAPNKASIKMSGRKVDMSVSIGSDGSNSNSGGTSASSARLIERITPSANTTSMNRDNLSSTLLNNPQLILRRRVNTSPILVSNTDIVNRITTPPTQIIERVVPVNNIGPVTKVNTAASSIQMIRSETSVSNITPINRADTVTSMQIMSATSVSNIGPVNIANTSTSMHRSIIPFNSMGSITEVNTATSSIQMIRSATSVNNITPVNRADTVASMQIISATSVSNIGPVCIANTSTSMHKSIVPFNSIGPVTEFNTATSSIQMIRSASSVSNITPVNRANTVTPMQIVSASPVSNIIPVTRANTVTPMQIISAPPVSNITPVTRANTVTPMQIISSPPVRNITPVTRANTVTPMQIISSPPVRNITPVTRANTVTPMQIISALPVSDITPVTRANTVTPMQMISAPPVSNIGPVSIANTSTSMHKSIVPVNNIGSVTKVNTATSSIQMNKNATTINNITPVTTANTVTPMQIISAPPVSNITPVTRTNTVTPMQIINATPVSNTSPVSTANTSIPMHIITSTTSVSSTSASYIKTMATPTSSTRSANSINTTATQSMHGINTSTSISNNGSEGNITRITIPARQIMTSGIPYTISESANGIKTIRISANRIIKCAMPGSNSEAADYSNVQVIKLEGITEMTEHGPVKSIKILTKPVSQATNTNQSSHGSITSIEQPTMSTATKGIQRSNTDTVNRVGTPPTNDRSISKIFQPVTMPTASTATNGIPVNSNVKSIKTIPKSAMQTMTKNVLIRTKSGSIKTVRVPVTNPVMQSARNTTLANSNGSVNSISSSTLSKVQMPPKYTLISNNTPASNVNTMTVPTMRTTTNTIPINSNASVNNIRPISAIAPPISSAIPVINNSANKNIQIVSTAMPKPIVNTPLVSNSSAMNNNRTTSTGTPRTTVGPNVQGISIPATRKIAGSVSKKKKTTARRRSLPTPLLKAIRSASLNTPSPSTSASASALQRRAHSYPSQYNQSFTVKSGAVVISESGLEDVAHVYQVGKVKYSVTLGKVDIQFNKNSYYKLQVLEHDLQERYWLFRCWGRIGTDNGSKAGPNEMSLELCISEFKRLYEEKTGNLWVNKDNFVKKPWKWYPIDTDEDMTTNEVPHFQSEIPSTLQKPVQDLISLIYNVNMMKNVMKVYDINVEQMPLGKLSKNQLYQAYMILGNIQRFIARGNPERIQLIDASNQFYTLIPHVFGSNDFPIINNLELLKSKCEMIESLIDIEIAYKLLNTNTGQNLNPLDAHYEQLHARIEVLDRNTTEFQLIEMYVANTHAATHAFALNIENVFKVERQGEDSLYEPFKYFYNRKLLWHGSRTTNFASILSQGLRIAPPEAPVSGYMFGKGIYFADMVSKSAQYCYADRQNPTGLLLLCEVALGNTYERYQSDNIQKLPNGKHSTFGKGQTCPNPTQARVLPNGVLVPCGKAIQANVPRNADLLYNEYIVYNVAQVKVQYLVRVKFDFDGAILID